jgi:hypothetical protein
MALKWTRRQALSAGVALCAGTQVVAAPGKLPMPETYSGKVKPLAELVAQIGSKLDPDAAPHWLALVRDDGNIFPLIKDSGGRMFFVDKRLLNRPMRITGRLLPGTQLLQVLEVQSLIKGVPHELYYWCDICTIRRNEKMFCECCGAMMDLKEVPLKK